MAELIYMSITSLDGYVNDRTGSFDWAVPDEAVHAFVNDLERPVKTSLYGRRLYEIMVGWDAPAETFADEPAVAQDFAALWKATDKIVYSRTLPAVSTTRTTLERSFEPDAVRALKASSPHDISIGGAELAGEAFRAGLVDEVRLFLNPVTVGSGQPAFLTDGLVQLALADERRFTSGVVYLAYRVVNRPR